jgi:uncharacterized alpha-E superfamily protein
LERIEGLSRLLLEFHQLLIQDQRSHVERGCALLTHGIGLDSSAKTTTELIEIVFGSSADSSTIFGALHGARSNARSIRDILPSDFYESINQLHAIADRFDVLSPGSSLKSLLDRLAVCNGIHEWLAPSDESAHFFELGRSLERMDLVSRLLLLKIEAEWKEQGPATTLRSVGGLSTFLKSRVPMTAERARSFLIKDQMFPRSLLATVRKAESSLEAICIFNGIPNNPMNRSIGLLKSEIQFMADNYSAENEIIHKVPAVVGDTSEAIRTHFFRPTGSIVWSN